MRVLCVSSWFPYPPDNGSKRRAFSLIRELASRHSITLLSFAEPGEAERGARGLGPFCRIGGVVGGNPARAPQQLPAIALLSSWPRSFGAGYSSEMQALVDAMLPDHEAVVAFQAGASLYLLNRQQIPSVFDEPEVTVLRERFLHERRLLPRARRALTWWKFSRFIRRLVLTADRTSVVSALERDQLVELGCPVDRLAVVPNGADLSDERQPHDVDRDTLIYTGALTYSANFDAVRWFLGEIWPLVLKDRPRAGFVVTGATEGVQVDMLPPAPQVTFTGYLDDVGPVLTRAAACIVPLRTGGGTRVKIVEALASGTPVVATTKAVEGLAVTNDTDVLLGDTPVELAAQIHRLLNDPALAARLSANGRALVATRYTWERSGARMARLIEDACATFAAARETSAKARTGL